MQGYSEKQIKKTYGHDLEKLAKTSNLVTVGENRGLLRSLNQYYATKDFDYPTIGIKDKPAVKQTFKLATEIYNEVDKMIRSN